MSRKSPGPPPLCSGTITESIRPGDPRPREIPGIGPEAAGSFRRKRQLQVVDDPVHSGVIREEDNDAISAAAIG